MKTYKYFIRWLLLSTLIGIGALFAFYYGIFHMIAAADRTGISIGIAALFIFFTVSSGVNTYRQEKSDQNIGYTYIHNVKFVSDIMPVLGMIGTVIGFVMMLETFSGLDANNKACVSAAIGQMGQGMGTALVTTLCGLVGHFLLRLQLHNFTKI